MNSKETKEEQPDGETQYRLARVLREDWSLLVLFVLAFAGAVWIYPVLPERVASHWNIHGQVDGWSSRMGATFGMLAMFVGIYVLIVVLPLIDPRRASYGKFLPTHRIIRWLVVFLCLGIWVFALAAARGMAMPFEKIVTMSVSLLFVVLGNIMPRLRPNWFAGIRTPWSLSSDEAWRLTHRVSGPVWVIGGMIGLVGGLFGGVVAAVMMLIGLGGATLFSVVYSYFAYKRSIRDTSATD